MKLIVGLGNIGQKYDNTRHNIGFTTLDFVFDNWLKKEGFPDWKETKKFQTFISEGNLNGDKIILAKPTTFMNNSGIAVQAIMSFYKIAPADLIVIHDDIDIVFGNYKAQTNRSSAGHKGVGSIIEKLGTQDFTRIRVGTGKVDKQKQGDATDFVLNRFGLLERLKLKEVKNKILNNLQNILQK